MNHEEAKNLIRETFQNTFDEGRFRLFAKNLFNDLDESKTFSQQGQYIPDAYKDHVHQYKRIGKYTDPAGAELDVLIVHLKRAASLERARTRQRNFIAWYLKRRGEKDAAIVAYHTEDLEDWRFSFVRMDYRTELNEKGKVRVDTELTPARRYSFLVGSHEPNHTAQQQLLPILQDDGHNPTLAELEKAFTIESVTREFFERYKELFLKLKDELDALLETDRRIGADFAAKNIKTTDFAKKLLGQIVFLYFLQKKGWLGVGKDEKGNFREWGAGPKNFLQRLFSREIVPYDNFFNDLLEPLFYEALATDRGEESYYSRFRCKIPFLNGGLFEPIGGYSWEQIDILIQNETFGDIFDTFDLYNFTVREDEPLEKEVAVDPEMLGKVFENLLEVKDRKSKGAYYTPREIVHYMCRESLINYLAGALNNVPLTPPLSHQGRGSLTDTPNSLIKGDLALEHLGIPPPLTGGGEGEGEMQMAPIPIEDIRLLICQGEFGIENDLAKEQGTKSYAYKLPESIRANAGHIDQALANIKICDPAIGSGAFPVGMLHEIVRARETLTTYLPENPARTPYHFKRHAIQQSIYGVDIDCGAVDIAKLRLWLSLVVDEDDFLSIKPLPNLDYKIVCGNSLLKVERNLLNNHLFEELELLKQRYFDEINPRQKKEEKARIEHLIRQLTNNDEQFDFEIYFSEVYHTSHSPLTQGGRHQPHCPLKGDRLQPFSPIRGERKGGGFDVVIANPPYVRQESIREFKPQFKRTFGAFYCGTADLYTYFYKRGLEILKPSGHLCFIAPNKFMRAGYGKNTRTLLANEATPKVVIDFGDLPIFDATTYPSILLLEKRKPEATEKTLTATFTVADQLANLDDTLSTVGFTMPIADLKAEGWTLERPDVLALMAKLRKAGTPLGEYVQGKFYYGIKTGLNEAFVIDAPTRQQLIAEDPKSAELIKPWLRGRDIRKWKAEWAGLYLIYIPWHFEKIEKYPSVKKHLEQFKSKLKKRGTTEQGRYEWYELQRYAADCHWEFEKPKIMWRHFTTVPEFIYDEAAHYSNDKSYILPTADLALLGILNSQVTNFFIRQISPPVRGGFMEMRIIFTEQLPIPSATDTQKAFIIERVRKILAAPDSPAVPRLEAEIDKLVYELYGLAEEEVALME